MKKINKTIILITHRLNSLKNVDLIVHLEKGQICTYSSYEESVKKNPLFNDIEKLKDLIIMKILYFSANMKKYTSASYQQDLINSLKKGRT